MRLFSALFLLFAATSAVAGADKVAQLQACLAQPIGPFELPVNSSDEQRAYLVEVMTTEQDKSCMYSAMQQCFLNENSDLCFDQLNIYVEAEYVRLEENRTPQVLDLNDEETLSSFVEILENYRTDDMASGSGFSCNYSTSTCDFILNSMLLGGLRSAVRISEHAN